MTRRSTRHPGVDIPLHLGDRAIEILAFLRKRPEAFISGADISRSLRVSRTAVWKHIGALREAGFEIEAHTSRGYRLIAAPDLLIPPELMEALDTRFIAREIRHLLSTDSTNRVAQDLAEAGAPEGTTVIAEEQTHGRGRLGRSWYSPPRTNIYASIILRPTIPLPQIPQLTLVGAVAAGRAISSVYDGPPGTGPRIKWPNDILIGGRKVSGTLVEATSVGEILRYVVLGIGINVNLEEKDLPPELSGTATSLLVACGHPVSRKDLAVRFFQALEACYTEFRQAGFSRLSGEYAGMSDLWGRQVRVSLSEGSVEGVAEGLEDDGALRVRTPAGDTERILAGDVQLLR